MPRHGIWTATPVPVEQTEVMEGTLKHTGAQRATCESRASLTCIHSRTLARANSTAHLCMWGRAVAWRLL